MQGELEQSKLMAPQSQDALLCPTHTAAYMLYQKIKTIAQFANTLINTSPAYQTVHSQVYYFAAHLISLVVLKTLGVFTVNLNS